MMDGNTPRGLEMVLLVTTYKYIINERRFNILLGIKLQHYLQNYSQFSHCRRILHNGRVAFSSIFCFAEKVSRFGQMLELQELGLDIKTGIKTFDS